MPAVSLRRLSLAAFAAMLAVALSPILAAQEPPRGRPAPEQPTADRPAQEPASADRAAPPRPAAGAPEQPGRPGARQPRVARGEPPVTEARPAPPFGPVRFEATVFEVAVPADRIVELDSAALAAAAKTPAELQKTLKAIGTTRTLYRLDQVVNLAQRASLDVTSDVPYVTARNSSAEGRTTTTAISREKTGVSFDLRGTFDADSAVLGVDISMELSATTDSVVKVDESISSPTFRRVRQAYAGQLVSERPVVLLTIDNSTATAGGGAYALITRIAFHEP